MAETTAKMANATKFPTWRTILLPLGAIYFIISGITMLRSFAPEDVAHAASVHPWKRAIHGVVSPNTVRAIENDELLKRNAVAMLDLAAGASAWLVERYPTDGIKEANDAINKYVRQLNDEETRGSKRRVARQAPPSGLPSFSDVMNKAAQAGNALAAVARAPPSPPPPPPPPPLPAPSAVASAAGAAADALSGAVTDLTSGGGSGGGSGAGSSILSTLSGGISSLGNSLLANAPGTGMFLGIGIGEGTASGLNLSTVANAKAVGAKVAADNGMQNTGLNPAVENTANGLMSTLLGSIDVKSLQSAGGGMLPPIGPAALGLATGLGNGAVKGLKINTNVPMPNPNGSSIADIATSFGFGLTNSVTGALDLKQLQALAGASSAGLMTNIQSQIGPASFGLAQGLGKGFVRGLKINAAVPLPDPKATGVADIANNFGFGLTDAVTSSIDFSQFAGLANAQTLGVITSQIAPGALGLAQGLGSGTVAGLKINNVPPPTGSDVQAIAGSFGYGLTQSVTSNIDFAKIMAVLSSMPLGDTSALVSKYLPPAASGFGKGLGKGAAVGFGVQPDMGDTPLQNAPDGTLDVGAVTQNFAMGLTSRLLQNGTVSKILSSGALMSGDATNSFIAKVDFSKVAGGFARGLLQGTSDGVTAMGGIARILNNTAKTTTTDVPETPLQFNDSINGAAIGFGQGLGAQGVVLVKALTDGLRMSFTTKRDTKVDTKVIRSRDIKFRQEGAVAPLPAADLPAPMASAPGTTTPNTPAPDTPAAISPAPPASDPALANGAPMIFNITALMDANGISAILQKGLDSLTTNGVGGMSLVGMGLYQSGTITLDPELLASFAKFKGMLPQGTIRIANSPHQYTIDPQTAAANMNTSIIATANAITVNGWGLPAFIAFVAIHIATAIIVMVSVAPVAIGLESVRNILDLIKKKKAAPWIRKWNHIFWGIVIAPGLVLILIFGFLAMGSSGHLRTAHSILGLLALLDGFAAVALHFFAPSTVRFVNGQILLGLITITTITGFSDLSQVAVGSTQVIPFAGAIAIGFGVFQPLVFGQLVSVLDMILSRREKRKPKDNKKDQIKHLG